VPEQVTLDQVVKLRACPHLGNLEFEDLSWQLPPSNMHGQSNGRLRVHREEGGVAGGAVVCSGVWGVAPPLD